MSKDFAAKLAQVITDYSVAMKPGDFVVIQGGVIATPMIEALFEAAVKKGANVTTQVGLPNLNEIYFRYAEGEQLDFLSPIQKLIVEEADVYLQIESPVNTRALTGSDPAKMARMQMAYKDILPVHLKRISDRSLRWCLLPWPTAAAAQQTEMGTLDYTDFLYRACGLHHDDPVAYWQSVRDMQLRLVDFLADKSHAQVSGPGIDLSFDFKGRTWVSAHGELNFPDGEIFTGPIEDSVNGTVDFNMRTIYRGREVGGVRFIYKDGLIVEASAEKGEAFLLSQLDLDEGARRMGEFAIGTNWGVDRVTGSTLLDEKIGGTIHMAIGASLPPTGAVNKSNVHWDMVHDMKAGGEIYIDGKLFYQSGKFMI